MAAGIPVGCPRINGFTSLSREPLLPVFTNGFPDFGRLAMFAVRRDPRRCRSASCTRDSCRPRGFHTPADRPVFPSGANAAGLCPQRHRTRLQRPNEVSISVTSVGLETRARGVELAETVDLRALTKTKQVVSRNTAASVAL